VLVRTGTGMHTVVAFVTFTDSTPARTLRMRFRSCAAELSHPPLGGFGFTG
jgi:hypothetical protein